MFISFLPSDFCMFKLSVASIPEKVLKEFCFIMLLTTHQFMSFLLYYSPRITRKHYVRYTRLLNNNLPYMIYTIYGIYFHIKANNNLVSNKIEKFRLGFSSKHDEKIHWGRGCHNNKLIIAIVTQSYFLKKFVHNNDWRY